MKKTLLVFEDNSERMAWIHKFLYLNSTADIDVVQCKTLSDLKIKLNENQKYRYNLIIIGNDMDSYLKTPKKEKLGEKAAKAIVSRLYTVPPVLVLSSIPEKVKEVESKIPEALFSPFTGSYEKEDATAKTLLKLLKL